MSGDEDIIGMDDYMGGSSTDGIMSRAVGYLYQQMAERRDQAKYSLSASYLEIYNEGGRGLIHTTTTAVFIARTKYIERYWKVLGRAVHQPSTLVLRYIRPAEYPLQEGPTCKVGTNSGVLCAGVEDGGLP